MANLLAQAIPLGDLQIYDNYVPSLAAGNWHIAVTHTLSGIDTGALGATQEFVVSAPQFSLDPSAVLSRYPPDGSTGLFAQVLPHVVLKDAMLPWERQMKGSNKVQPWLALLVLEEEEILGAPDVATRVQSTTVSAFLSSDPAILKPSAIREDDVSPTDPCTFVQIGTSTFTAVTPRLEELRFLAHCRQSNIADKAEQGLEDNGLFSIVVSNRLPGVPAVGVSQPRKSIAHLVSLEGLESYLTDTPNFGSYTSVAMVSLASWTFLTLPENLQDFRGLMNAIVAQEYDGTTYSPDVLWLRLPAPQPPIDTSTTAGAEVSQRLAAGYVPLQYQLRTGEQTLSWYRGPLTPVLPAILQIQDPLLTADSALIYQKSFGVFDASLAVAWEIGRALALSDRSFGQLLFDFRRRGHRLTDALFERLQSDAFTATQISQLSSDTSIQDEFLQILNKDLLNDIGAPAQPTSTPPKLMAGNDPDADPKTALQRFLAEPDVQSAILTAAGDDLDPIATWLARLRLLYNVPFNLLVPDNRMLEMETLRFFYVDGNWLRCLHDGAVSIAMESSRETFFHAMTQDLIFNAATEAVQVYRGQLIGVNPPAPPAGEDLISGFLLRSAVVSGWPNLAVRGGKNDGTYLKILRMDHVAPNLLLCMFLGVPDFVEFSEPQEGFRFGVDDDGNVPLRQPLSGTIPLGTQLSKTLTIVPSCLRSPDTKVFNLISAGGLLDTVQAALKAAGAPLASLGPSDLALQMVKSPEAIRFNTQTV
ncbi:MAG TPA: hypothetical protein VK608_06010 [Edaphobacter sp.]|nr:hypothetical protein [Edaphobacter sp.]